MTTSEDQTATTGGDSDLLVDSHDRRVTYARLSVTDRCNFQCLYCMPEGGLDHAPRDEQLTFDEWEAVARILAEHGVRKIRLTGGEPLVRANLPELVDRLTDIDALEHVAMTTNAFLLERHVDALEEAGLTSINISLDTLDGELFEKMTQTGSLDRVLRGIEAARSANFDPVKLNTVVVRGFNDDELSPLVRFAADNDLPIRFIEFMPIGQETIWGNDSDQSRCLPAAQIRQQLRQDWELTPDDDTYGAGPATYWRAHGADLPNAGHPVGIIGAVTECFCSQCNRLRITATGGIRACLADDREISVRAPLRTHADADDRRGAVIDRLRRALAGKKESHDFERQGDGVTDTAMTAVGG
jgi:cyclic pyranopterin phosphate synthase